MHVEYGDLDSDYVFVNLFAGPVGAPMSYHAVHQLIRRIAARTGVGFTAHMLRHSHATEHDPAGRADRGRGQVVDPPLVDDHEPDLHPPRRSRYPRGPATGRRVAAAGPVNDPARSRAEALRLTVVAGETARSGRRVGQRQVGRHAPRRSRAARARLGPLRHDQPAWLRDPAKRWCRFRLATGCAFATINAGALALSRFSWFLDERHPEVTAARDHPAGARGLPRLAGSPGTTRPPHGR